MEEEDFQGGVLSQNFVRFENLTVLGPPSCPGTSPDEPGRTWTSLDEPGRARTSPDEPGRARTSREELDEPERAAQAGGGVAQGL